MRRNDSAKPVDSEHSPSGMGENRIAPTAPAAAEALLTSSSMASACALGRGPPPGPARPMSTVSRSVTSWRGLRVALYRASSSGCSRAAPSGWRPSSNRHIWRME